MYNPLTGMYDNHIEKARQLADIELQEISLVDKAANKKKFLFFKSSGDGSTVDLLDTIESIEKNFKLSDRESKQIEKAIVVLNKLDSDEIDSITNLCLLLAKASGVQLQQPQFQAVVKTGGQVDKWPSFNPDNYSDEED